MYNRNEENPLDEKVDRDKDKGIMHALKTNFTWKTFKKQSNQ